MTSACKNLLENAEKKVSKAINDNVLQLNQAVTLVKKNYKKNLLYNFLVVIVLLIFSIAGITYFQNYRDGISIARQKAEEVLETERLRLENELSEKENQIEQNAVITYKNSKAFREDSCKFVANNITKLECGYYLFKYTKSEDIKKWPQIKFFYKNFLEDSYIDYKKKKSN